MKAAIAIVAAMSVTTGAAAMDEVYFDDGSSAWLIECANPAECVTKLGEPCKALGYRAYDMDGKEVDMRAISRHGGREAFAVKCRKEGGNER